MYLIDNDPYMIMILLIIDLYIYIYIYQIDSHNDCQISLRHSVRQSGAIGPCGRAITTASRLGAGPEVGEQAPQLHYEQI